VRFTVTRHVDADARRVWDELIDWPGHGAWIPATRVESHSDGAPTDVGYTFTAWTGVRPLALEDRMQVTACAWDDDTKTGSCTVDKLGPVLHGEAGFTVRPAASTTTTDGRGATIEWREDVTVRFLPRLLSPIATIVGRLGFTMALRSLARQLARTPTGSPPVD
jgi:hypothetical protein